nr:hypothetical protein [Acidobacteriota bacterium]
MLTLLTVLLHGWLAVLLLRYALLGGGRRPRWSELVPPGVALALAAGHASVAGGISLFYVLFALPAYGAAAALFAGFLLRRLFRRRWPGDWAEETGFGRGSGPGWALWRGVACL